MLGLIFKIITLPIRLLIGGRGGSPLGGILKLGFLLVIVFLLLRSCTGMQPASKQPIAQRSNTESRTSLKVCTPPTFGKPRYYTSESNVSPLKISTQTGNNFFVVLKDSRTKTKKVDVFLQGGQESEFMIPAGDYEIEYSVGITWYGDENLFGPETQTAKVTGVASFKNGVGASLNLRRTR